MFIRINLVIIVLINDLFISWTGPCMAPFGPQGVYCLLMPQKACQLENSPSFLLLAWCEQVIGGYEAACRITVWQNGQNSFDGKVQHLLKKLSKCVDFRVRQLH